MDVYAKLIIEDKEALKSLDGFQATAVIDGLQLIRGKGEITVPLKKSERIKQSLSSQYEKAKNMVAEFESSVSSNKNESEVTASIEDDLENGLTLTDRLKAATSALMKELRDGVNPKAHENIEKVCLSRIKFPFTRSLYLKKVESDGKKLLLTDGFSDFTFDIEAHNQALDNMKEEGSDG